jgi:hypothetical protein
MIGVCLSSGSEHLARERWLLVPTERAVRRSRRPAARDDRIRGRSARATTAAPTTLPSPKRSSGSKLSLDESTRQRRSGLGGAARLPDSAAENVGYYGERVEFCGVRCAGAVPGFVAERWGEGSLVADALGAQHPEAELLLDPLG